jgi:hypothetical protein
MLEAAYYVQRCSCTFQSRTIVIYNASAVKIYYATNSQVRNENKNVFFYFKNALVYVLDTTLAL